MRHPYRLIVLGALTLNGCEGGQSQRKAAPSSAKQEVSPPAKEETRPANSENSTLISTQIGGTWVFFWPELPAGANVIAEQSRVAGKVRMVEGCLYVGEQVVIWQKERRGDIEAALREVREGKEVSLEGTGASFPPVPSTNDPEAQAGSDTQAQAKARVEILSKCPSVVNVFGTGRDL